MDGTEQPGQEKDLEDDVGLDDEGVEDEEDLAEEIEIADQVQSEVADGDQVRPVLRMLQLFQTKK